MLNPAENALYDRAFLTARMKRIAGRACLRSTAQAVAVPAVPLSACTPTAAAAAATSRPRTVPSPAENALYDRAFQLALHLASN